MRIQLKQHEIEAALKGYISQQGIAVDGKAVVMAFKSGRKSNGLSVVVLIDESEQVPAVAKAAEPVVVDQITNATAVAPDVPDQSPKAVAAATEKQDTAPAATPVSLFGG